MDQISLDDWNRHWTDFGAASEAGPTPKYRRRLIFRLLRGIPKDDSVRMLEIGSGMGEFAEEFCGRFPRSKFLGLELSAVGVEVSNRRRLSARFLQRDLLQAPSSDAELDFGATDALCTEVLEHLDIPGVLLQNAATYMSPGCRLIATVPGGPMNAFYRHIGHRRHYSPGELKDLLEASGFAVDRTYAAGFPFFNVFRLFMTWRGDRFIQTVSGTPSLLVRVAGKVFEVLFRLNLMRWGWQTIAVARYTNRSMPEADDSNSALAKILKP
jgi:SAM-dependent methyltransferase